LKISEIIQNVFSDHSGVKLDINNRKIGEYNTLETEHVYIIHRSKKQPEKRTLKLLEN
jgi:hypothetical protein